MGEIAEGSVTTSKLADGAVTFAKIAADSVAPRHIVDGGVGRVKLAEESVTGAKVLDDSLTAADLADGSVTSREVADNSLTAADLAENSVTDSELADNAVSHSHIQVGSIRSLHLANGAVTEAKMNMDLGVRGRLVRASESVLDSNRTKQHDATCPSGTLPLGGGAVLMTAQNTVPVGVALTGSYPLSSGWRAQAIEVDRIPFPWKITVYVICADVAFHPPRRYAFVRHRVILPRSAGRKAGPWPASLTRSTVGTATRFVSAATGDSGTRRRSRSTRGCDEERYRPGPPTPKAPCSTRCRSRGT